MVELAEAEGRMASPEASGGEVGNGSRISVLRSAETLEICRTAM